MNWDQVEGNWKQIKGLLETRWGKLTDDDFAVAKGDRAILAGQLQEHYGLSKEDAERELDEVIRECKQNDYGHPEVATEGKPLDTATLKIGMN